MPNENPEIDIETLKSMLADALVREGLLESKVATLEGENSYLTDAVALILPGFASAVDNEGTRNMAMMMPELNGRIPILFIPAVGKVSDAIIDFCAPLLARLTLDDCQRVMERVTKGQHWCHARLR